MAAPTPKYVIMSMLKKYLLLFIVALTAFAASAQTPAVRWRTQVRMQNATEGTVTFRALIAEGWRLYGLTLPEGGPRPTHFDLAESNGIEFTGPVRPERAPLSVDDPLFDMTLTWWDSNIAFTAPFRVTDPATAAVKAKITYMACDGNSCLPPKTESIAAPVRIPAQR